VIHRSFLTRLSALCSVHRLAARGIHTGSRLADGLAVRGMTYAAGALTAPEKS
jgi:hypothetical protein